jgi:hypothetical protein
MNNDDTCRCYRDLLRAYQQQAYGMMNAVCCNDALLLIFPEQNNGLCIIGVLICDLCQWGRKTLTEGMEG